MTKEELEEIRIRLGLSVAKFARVLGLTPAQVHNMKSGRQEIKPFNANAIRWLEALHIADKENIALPEELRNAKR